MGRCMPALSGIREVSVAVAAAVAEHAYEMGVATVPRAADLVEAMRDAQWVPAYELQKKLTMSARL